MVELTPEQRIRILERQLQQAQTMMNPSGISGVPVNTNAYYQAQNLGSQLAHLRALAQQEAAQKRQAEQQAAAEAERQAGLDLTEGRAQAILDDPVMADALAALRGAATGESLPFSDQAMSLMQGRYGDMVAAQQGAAQDQLRAQMAASGLNPDDPSAQARMRQLTEAGAANRAGNWRDLLIQQQMQNYAAQQQAANQLMLARGGQYALGNPLAQQAAGYHISAYDEPVKQVTQRYRTPTYNQPMRTPLQTPQMGNGMSQQPNQPQAQQQFGPLPYEPPRQRLPTQQSRPGVYVGGADYGGGQGITGAPQPRPTYTPTAASNAGGAFTLDMDTLINNANQRSASLIPNANPWETGMPVSWPTIGPQ